MRVLVNLTWLVPGTVGGSEESTTDALRALLEHEPEAELTLAVLSGFAAAHGDLADACRCEVLDSTGSNKVARVAAEQTWLARRTRALAPDVVHHAGGVMPLRHPGRTVLTIHDLQPLDMPENFSFAKRTYISAMIGRSARAADVVAVPSHFTASRVTKRLKVPRARLTVVPWSVVSLDKAQNDTPLVQSDSGDGPLFVYPAITYPHKNHLVLLEAFARYRAHEPSARLVLAGGVGPTEVEVSARMGRADLAGAVERPGRVTRAEMEQLYGAATAVLVPSRYEGFGLPALEAMSRGAPLVVSDAGSLPEVVGGGGAKAMGASTALPVAPVDPDDVAGWALAMEATAALDDSERERLGESEMEIARSFTPRRTAEALMAAFRFAAAKGGSGSEPGRVGS
ncbi:MAG: glycosyltransferase family 4 protein [Microthrixaceae bacterium]